MDGQSWSFKKKSKKIVDFQTKLSKKMLRTNTKKKSWIVWDCNRNDIPSSYSTLIYKMMKTLDNKTSQ